MSATGFNSTHGSVQAVQLVFLAGSSNLDPGQLAATFYQHGTTAAILLPAADAIVTNNPGMFPFKSLGNGWFSFYYAALPADYRGMVVFSYRGIAVQAVTLAPYARAAGTGDLSAIAVDHNYPTLDNLTVQTATGVPVVGATIRAFLQVDYDAGLRTAAYVKGSTVTGSSGHWLTPIMLDPATYTLLIYKLGETLTTVVPLTVTAHV